MRESGSAASLVVIASPSAASRKRWRQGLGRMFAVHEASDQPALERSLAQLNPAVLVLDLALPTRGVARIPSIQRLSPWTKILLLADTADEKETISALKAGAKGCHSKDIDPYLLNKAVQMVQKGEIWVKRTVVPHLLGELMALTERAKQDPPASSDGRLDGLTLREREIAHLVAEGAGNKEIASQLTVSEKTVKAHLTTVFRKLNLAGRLQLALFVSEHTPAANQTRSPSADVRQGHRLAITASLDRTRQRA